eukprot:RCo026629
MLKTEGSRVSHVSCTTAPKSAAQESRLSWNETRSDATSDMIRVTSEAEFQESERDCKGIVSLEDLRVSFPPELRMPLNPFKMKFVKEHESEYAEWVRLNYIPARAWLALSGILVIWDAVVTGMPDATPDVLLVHIVASLQLVICVLMSIPRLYPLRRYLVYILFFHVVVFTGMVTQQSVTKVSGVHQNNFAVVPYFCGFLCMITSQIPARQSLWLMCLAPAVNALWRVLLYYPVPSVSVLLMWWSVIAAWIYASERMTRNLYGWLLTLKELQSVREREQAQTAALLQTLVPPAIARHLKKCSAQASAEQHRRQSAANARLQLRSTCLMNSQAIVIVICLAPTPSGCKLDTSFDVKRLDEVSHIWGFQRLALSFTRYTCVLMSSDNDAQLSGFLWEAFHCCERSLNNSSHRADVFFSLDIAPAVSGLLANTSMCRPSCLSCSFPQAHTVASSLVIKPAHGLVAFRRSALALVSAHLCVSEMVECDDTIVAVRVPDLSRQGAPEPPHFEETSVGVDLLLSVISLAAHAEDSESGGEGLVPRIRWRALVSLGGLRYDDDEFEAAYKKFIVKSVPELFFVLAVFQLFCGTWSIVGLLGAVLPCHLSSGGGVSPWVAAHAVLFLFSCGLIFRLVRLARSSCQREDRSLKCHVLAVLGLMFCHYVVCIASVYVQPNLYSASNWTSYHAVFFHGHAEFVNPGDQWCINTLYDMAYFILFALTFCVGVIPIFLSTTLRLGLILTLFLSHSAVAVVLLHHLDLIELGVVLCNASYLFAVETIVRIFYRTLIEAHQCRIETERQPELQHRNAVMLASMPERLLQAPDNTLTHTLAGLLCVRFTTFSHPKIYEGAVDLGEVFADFNGVVGTVQTALDLLTIDASIVQCTLSDGSPGLLVLLPYGSCLSHDGTTPLSAAFLALGRLLLAHALSLSLPASFQMSAVLRLVRESCHHGSHAVDEDSVAEAERLLLCCPINCLACGGSALPAMRFPAPTLPTHRSNTRKSRAPSRTSSGGGSSGGGGVRTSQHIMGCVALAWVPRFHSGDIGDAVSVTEEEAGPSSSSGQNVKVFRVDAEVTTVPPEADELARFNDSYVLDLLTVYTMVKAAPGILQFQQTTSHGFHVLVLQNNLTAAASLAYSVYQAILASNPDTFCVGVGV